jgi:hypothetical protein
VTRRLLLVAALAIALVGCGISSLPKDAAPRPIDAAKVPFNLLGPSTTKPGDGAGGAGSLVKVWFVASQQLESVTRTVGDNTPAMVLDALVKGVATGDPAGLSSAIPQNTTIVSTELDGSTLVVTLSSEILSVTGPEQKNAFAQLVYTAADLPGVSGVRFRALDSSGQPQDLEPTTDTGNKAGPLTPFDFNSVAPAR